MCDTAAAVRILLDMCGKTHPTFFVCLFTFCCDWEQQQHGQYWLGHHGQQLHQRTQGAQPCGSGFVQVLHMVAQLHGEDLAEVIEQFVWYPDPCVTSCATCHQPCMLSSNMQPHAANLVQLLHPPASTSCDTCVEDNESGPHLVIKPKYIVECPLASVQAYATSKLCDHFWVAL
eukprot:GHUV01029039.1.p1 GENE.GHUV01029039.1~~GHUV01029039.1.p1  ORF type:complete len:174 (+),score=33.39 GHUV01029039.1:406-927(+)